MNKEHKYLDALFARLSDVQVREAGLQALRLWMKEHGPLNAGLAPLVNFGDWYHKLFDCLADELPIRSQQPDALCRSALADYRPRLSAVVLNRSDLAPKWFWQWMERAGYAVPLNKDLWAITDSGVRRLESDHPCRPGAFERLRSSSASEFTDSLDRIDDALACLEAGLARPAVVLLGLAYEEMIIVLARIEGKPVDQLKHKNASARQEELRKRIEHQPANEDRMRALIALHVADNIRTERNDAAHKAAGEWDLVEAEALLTNGISAYGQIAGYQPP